MPKSVDPEQSPFERAIQQGLVSRSTDSKVSSNVKSGDWIETFLSAIMQGSSVTDATNLVGVHITLPYKRRTTDEAFKRAWREAADIGTEFLEQEAARRAYHGTLKPVFHKGEQCGFVREYSDTLMIFLLKARKPEMYRDNVEDGVARGSFVLNVNIVNVDGPESVLDSLDQVPLLDVKVVDDDDKQND